MPEGLTPAVDRSTKDCHIAAERLWMALPALYRRGVSAHLFSTPDGMLGEFHPGMEAVLILTPAGAVGEVVTRMLVDAACGLSDQYFGTNGVDRRNIPW